MPLDLQYISKKVSIVPLETSPNCLISNSRWGFCIGEHYIVVESNDKLYQFDRSGKFVRTLATKGKGPEDFVMNMDSKIVRNEFLFFDPGEIARQISGFNLTDGSSVKYPIETNSKISGFIVDDSIGILTIENTLKDNRLKPSIRLYNIRGEFAKELYNGAEVDLKQRQGYMRLLLNGSNICYSSKRQDSVFEFSGFPENPKSKLIWSAKVKSNGKHPVFGELQDVLELIGFNSNTAIINKQELKARGKALHRNWEYYYWERRTGKIIQWESAFIDGKIHGISPNNLTDAWSEEIICFAIPAINFMELAPGLLDVEESYNPVLVLCELGDKS